MHDVVVSMVDLIEESQVETLFSHKACWVGLFPVSQALFLSRPNLPHKTREGISLYDILNSLKDGPG